LTIKAHVDAVSYTTHVLHKVFKIEIFLQVEREEQNRQS